MRALAFIFKTVGALSMCTFFVTLCCEASPEASLLESITPYIVGVVCLIVGVALLSIGDYVADLEGGDTI